PVPSSVIRMSERPPDWISTVMRFACASREFSTSSFTTLAGRSTTSPAAIWFATCSGNRRMRFMFATSTARRERRSRVRLASFHHRQAEGEDGAALRPVPGRDPALVVLDDPAADGQPQPGAMLLPVGGECLEKLTCDLGRDARSGVLHLGHHRSILDAK